MKISTRHKYMFFALLPVLLCSFLLIAPTLAQQPPIINSSDSPADRAAELTWNRTYLRYNDLCYDKISNLDVYSVGGSSGDRVHTTDSPPTVAITSPTAGNTLEGTVTISATASDDIGVSDVEFYVDGYLVKTDTSTPYSYTWDTTLETNGEHKLRVEAYDTIDQFADDEITVIVQNFAKISITSLDIPSEVTTGEEFTVYATIVNSGTIDAKYVQATIHLPVSMVLTSSYETQTVGTISTGGSITVSWTVRAQKAGKTTGGIISTPIEQTEDINVTITSSNAGSNSENGTTVVKPSPTYHIMYTSVLGIPVLAFAAILIIIPLVAFFSIRYILENRDLEDIRPSRFVIQKTPSVSPTNGDFEQGLTYFEQRNYLQAIESFEQTVKIKPGLEDAWYFMGLAYEELENQEKAIEAFETVVTLDLERVDAWNHLARIYFALEKPKKALECLEKVVNVTPEDADAWNGMSTICKALGWNTKAENYLNKAIELDPRYSEAISWPEKLPEISPEYLTVEPSEIISCPFCSETIPSGMEKCPTCGEKAVKCPICMTPIEFGDEFVKCPHCNTLAHRSHLLEWIKIKGICPVCRKILRDIDILD